MRAVCYRHAAYDTPWRTTAGADAGRFHRADSDITQYLSLHPLGPTAEMLRHVIGPAGSPDDLVLNLWACTVNLEGVVAVEFANCGDYGITADELVGDDYAPTQAFADEVRARGASGVIVPSAALPGTENLALFGPRVLHPYLMEPFISEEVPTGHLTDGARPAQEATALVRWFGTPHRALEQWKATGNYERLVDALATR